MRVWYVCVSYDILVDVRWANNATESLDIALERLELVWEPYCDLGWKNQHILMEAEPFSILFYDLERGMTYIHDLQVGNGDRTDQAIITLHVRHIQLKEKTMLFTQSFASVNVPSGLLSPSFHSATDFYPND